MQIMITHGNLARTRVVNLNGLELTVLAFSALIAVLSLSAAMYHFVLLKAAHEGWPVVSQVVKFVVRDEIAQRDRYMRENLDAMARRVGEMQAKLLQLEAVGERVSGLAGLRPEDLRGSQKPAEPTSRDNSAADGAKGGPYVPASGATAHALETLETTVDALDQKADRSNDLFVFIESRLQESRLRSLMVPSTAPVDGPMSSGFGFRSDPFTGRGALHTGLDFPAEIGTPIVAAAGGMVVAAGVHPQYGNKVEVDHGNGLVTRYAHASRLLVKEGDLVKRGQTIALVGSTGRSTGPHLHFEVLLQGVPQNPTKFLGHDDAGQTVASSTPAQRRRSHRAAATGDAVPADAPQTAQDGAAP